MERRKKITKIILITITLLFLLLMLAAPLLSVLVNSLKEGIGFYVQAISTPYVVSALLVTLLATVIAVVGNTFFGICAAWLLTKFSFRGKQILATLIDIPFSISPVIVGLSYLMTFEDWDGFIRRFGRLTSSLVRISELHLQYRVLCSQPFLLPSRLYRERFFRC